MKRNGEEFVLQLAQVEHSLGSKFVSQSKPELAAIVGGDTGDEAGSFAFEREEQKVVDTGVVVGIHVGWNSIANDGLPALESNKGLEATSPARIGLDRSIERESIDTTRNSSDSGVGHGKSKGPRESARERAGKRGCWKELESEEALGTGKPGT